MNTKNGRRISYSPIGIDIGSRSINTVQLTASSGDLHLHEADIMMLPDEKVFEESTIVDALSDMIKRNKFKGRDVVSRMPPSLVSIIPMKISPRENESVEQAILREAKEYLPYPVEEAVIDYLPLNNIAENGDRHRKVLLIFAKRSDVIGHLNSFKKVGLKVQAIDIGPNAINRALKRFKKPSEKHILVINIGDANSFSTILWEDMVLIDRKMGWSEDNVIKKIVSTLTIDSNEARRILYRYGIDWSSTPPLFIDDVEWVMPEDDIPFHIYEIIAPALEDLNNEIEKILIYCTSEMKGAMIDQIYIIGSGGFVKHLNMYLQKTFGIGVKSFEPVEIFDQAAPVKTKVKENFPIFIVSIGLALRGLNA